MAGSGKTCSSISISRMESDMKEMREKRCDRASIRESYMNLCQAITFGNHWGLDKDHESILYQGLKVRSDSISSFGFFSDLFSKLRNNKKKPISVFYWIFSADLLLGHLFKISVVCPREASADERRFILYHRFPDPRPLHFFLLGLGEPVDWLYGIPDLTCLYLSFFNLQRSSLKGFQAHLYIRSLSFSCRANDLRARLRQDNRELS